MFIQRGVIKWELCPFTQGQTNSFARMESDWVFRLGFFLQIQSISKIKQSSFPCGEPMLINAGKAWLLFEMLWIRMKKPSLNTQSDSIKIFFNSRETIYLTQWTNITLTL